MEFEEIYYRYFRDVFRYIRSFTPDEITSEEVTQETFVKALKSLHQFDGKKDIRAWLFTIAKHTYFSYCRKKNARSILQNVKIQQIQKLNL